jgi:hypothetical protein
MTDSEPPRSSQGRERQDLAELLGRILAAYWLACRRPTADPPVERMILPDEKRD